MTRLSRATRAFALFLAIALIAAPLCPPHRCAHACCAARQHDCGSGLGWNLACLQASAPAAPTPSADLALTFALAQTPGILVAPFHAAFLPAGASSPPRASAPPSLLPLRI